MKSPADPNQDPDTGAACSGLREKATRIRSVPPTQRGGGLNGYCYGSPREKTCDRYGYRCK